MSAQRRTDEHVGPAVPTSPARHALDLAALGALLLLGMLGFDTVYDGVRYLLTGVGALSLGLTVALIGARFRWGPLRVLALLIAVYFLFGSMLAAPQLALWGFLPTADSLTTLLVAPVTSWKIVLTTEPPVGASHGALAVVWISMLLTAVLPASILLRSRRHVLAWTFPFVLILITVLFGTTEQVLPALRGVLFAVLSVAWLTWRVDGERCEDGQARSLPEAMRPSSWTHPALRRRMISGAVTLALAGGAGLGAQPLLDPPEGTVRYAHRDAIMPPFDPQQHVSPLTEFRGYLTTRRDDVLFTATGLQSGDRVRLATMDRYDLQVYNVSGSDATTGASGTFLRAGVGASLGDDAAAPRTSTLTIDSYSGVWLPTLGARTDRIDLDGMTGDLADDIAKGLSLHEESQTMVNAGGMQEGDSYVLSYQPYTAPTLDQQRTARFAEIPLPLAPRIDEVQTLAQEWAGTTSSDHGKVMTLIRSIRAGATFSHGIEDGEAPSLSGHGAGRLLAMLEPAGDDGTQAARPDGRIGDEEQFAALTALMARSIGIPARVAMGFEVGEADEGTAEITGGDVTAWLEVAFDGDPGWVRFDVAPEREDDPAGSERSMTDEPLPRAVGPEPSATDTAGPRPVGEDQSSDHDGESRGSNSWAGYAPYSTIPLLLAALALAAAPIAKAVRRRHRRARGSPPARVAGGWQELLDGLADQGYRVCPHMTRAEIAVDVHRDHPALEMPLLAARADRAVLGPDDLPDTVAEEYWAQITAARASMAASAPRHRRLRAVFSLRSFCGRARHGPSGHDAQGARWRERPTELRTGLRRGRMR